MGLLGNHPTWNFMYKQLAEIMIGSSNPGFKSGRCVMMIYAKHHLNVQADQIQNHTLTYPFTNYTQCTAVTSQSQDFGLAAPRSLDLFGTRAFGLVPLG